MPTITAQDVKSLSLKTKPFWLGALQVLSGKANPYFSIKICYLATELTHPQLAARFSPFELEQDSYFELTDFSINPLAAGRRQLHRLPYRPLADWAKDSIFFPNSNGGTYLIPLSFLELVQDQDISDPAPFLTPEEAPEPVVSADALGAAEPEYQAEAPMDGLPDIHPGNLSTRDEYALRYNVPVSNNAWINNMINFGLSQLRDQEVEKALAIHLAIQNASK